MSNLLFNKKAGADDLNSLDAASLKMVAREIPSFTISRDLIANGVSLIDLMAEHTTMVDSKSEARRTIKGNAVSINKEKVSNENATVTAEQLLHGRFIMVENGKKNKFILMAE